MTFGMEYLRLVKMCYATQFLSTKLGISRRYFPTFSNLSAIRDIIWKLQDEKRFAVETDADINIPVERGPKEVQENTEKSTYYLRSQWKTYARFERNLKNDIPVE